MKRLAMPYGKLAGLLCLMASPALAAPQCGPHDDVKAGLARNYSERPVAIGLAANNTLMGLYASDSGSWTLTVTMPDGTTCLVASGQGFEAVAPVPAGVPG